MEDQALNHGSQNLDDDQSEVADEMDQEKTESPSTNGQTSEKFQIQIGESNDQSTEPTDYSLFSNPPNLGLIRQRIFELEDVIELTASEFEEYWPFVDNIWGKCRAGPPTTESGVTTEWYWCKLRKPSNHKPQPSKPTPEGRKSRKKRTREDVNCGMSVKVIHTPGSEKSCRIVRGVERDVKHTHDLDYLDSLKRNSGIMDTVRREAVKGFLPSSIFGKMWEEPEKMREAGGTYLKMSDVRNLQYAWRQENPNAILRAHSGFLGKIHGPRPRVTAPLMQIKTALDPEPREISNTAPPFDTLRYPLHARDFLEPYLPIEESLSSRPRTLPHVTLTYASSLDSRISLAPGLQTALSGPESKALTHYLRSRHDAILIGVRTAISDDPSLNCRLQGSGGYGGYELFQQPRPIIIDPHARLHIRPDMKMLKMAAEGRGRAPWIVVEPGAMLHPIAVSTLKAHGGEYLMVHDYRPNGPGLNWEGIFRILFNEGIKSIMIEGGGIVLSELLKVQYAHLIDTVIITIAPTFLGKGGVQVSPDQALDSHGQPIATRLKMIKWQPMGNEDVIMCGKIKDESPGQGRNGIVAGTEEFFRKAAAEPLQIPGYMATKSH